MDLLGAGIADVMAEHDVVGRLAVHVGLAQGVVKELDVAAAEHDGELDDEGLLGAGRPRGADDVPHRV